MTLNNGHAKRRLFRPDNVSLKEAASAIGASPIALWFWENVSLKGMPLDKAAELASLYRISIDALVGRE